MRAVFFCQSNKEIGIGHLKRSLSISNALRSNFNCSSKFIVYGKPVLLENNPKIINLNIGTGKGTSVLQLIRTFEQVNNTKIPFKFTERREGDCASVIADTKLASSLLSWSPKRDINQMCIDGWKWQYLNPKGYI